MIDINEMRPQLLTLDEVRTRLEPTENLSQFDFSTDGEDTVKFEFPDNWNVALDTLDDNDLTFASVSVNGTERQLTKQAVLQATTAVGLADKYVLNSPGELIALNMDYWYTHGDKRLKMLASPSAAVAFTRETISPFSNLKLLDQVVDGIQEKYQTDDILADYKLHHDLKQTTLRLIVPSHARNIGSARVESAGNDPWSVGIELRNSLIGTSSTQMHGYLFAWWCTNGATSTHLTSGKFRRKPTANPDDVYDWARVVVDDVLGGLESELDSVEGLTQVPLEGDLNQTLGAMFDRFKVPTRQRELVLGNLAEADDLSAYGLLNAVTQAANVPDLSGSAVDALLKAGGEMGHALAEACEYCHRM